jgi:hypothetical protein
MKCRQINFVWRARNLKIVMEADPDAFYLTEMARDVRKSVRPTRFSFTGWRAVDKRK